MGIVKGTVRDCNWVFFYLLTCGPESIQCVLFKSSVDKMREYRSHDRLIDDVLANYVFSKSVRQVRGGCSKLNGAEAEGRADKNFIYWCSSALSNVAGLNSYWEWADWQ